jgi:DNA-damage-inducible protein J
MMYRPIPVEEVIAALPKKEQEAIAKRGAELVARVERRMAKAQNAAEHDANFRAKVQEALDDPRPDIPHERVKAHFAKRRAAALSKE